VIDIVLLLQGDYDMHHCKEAGILNSEDKSNECWHIMIYSGFQHYKV